MYDTELDVDAFTCESVHEGSLDNVQQSTEKLVLIIIKLWQTTSDKKIMIMSYNLSEILSTLGVLPILIIVVEM